MDLDVHIQNVTYILSHRMLIEHSGSWQLVSFPCDALLPSCTWGRLFGFVWNRCCGVSKALAHVPLLATMMMHMLVQNMHACINKAKTGD